MFQVRPTLAEVKGKPVTLEMAGPGKLADLREAESAGELRCPVCGQTAALTADSESLVLSHGRVHPAEDVCRHRVKRILKEHMLKLFPSATVEMNVLIDVYADVVVVKPDGGMLAVHLISDEVPQGWIRETSRSLEAQAIKPLFLLDDRRLEIRKATANLAACNIRQTEIEFLRASLPLLFMNPKGQIRKVILPGKLSSLIEDPATRSFGRIHVAFETHRLSSLRVIQGEWNLPQTFNRLPEPPRLPKRLELRIHRKRQGR